MAHSGEVKLFVKNLPWSATEDSLYETFGAHGEVTFARLCTDRETGRSRGFGFVSFSSDEAAVNAMKNLDGKDIDGRNIEVRKAEERAPQDRNAGGAPGVCFAFQKGNCRFGDTCKFSHNGEAGSGGSGQGEKKFGKPCFAFQKGSCTFGDSCRFEHEGNAEPETPTANNRTSFESDDEDAQEENPVVEKKTEKKSKKSKKEESDSSSSSSSSSSEDEEEAPKKEKKSSKKRSAKEEEPKSSSSESEEEEVKPKKKKSKK